MRDEQSRKIYQDKVLLAWIRTQDFPDKKQIAKYATTTSQRSVFKVRISQSTLCVLPGMLIVTCLLYYDNIALKTRTVHIFFLSLFLVLYFCILICVFSLFFVLFCVLFLLLCCLFPIFVQIYRPLPPGGNPIAVNKYHII